jgi:hypothetical protein
MRAKFQTVGPWSRHSWKVEGKARNRWKHNTRQASKSLLEIPLYSFCEPLGYAFQIGKEGVWWRQFIC